MDETEEKNHVIFYKQGQQT